MTNRPTLPTYRDLFGDLDLSQADLGRSALSPAAYLADLLQLLEDRFATPDFFDRRPDIRYLLLDGEQTFALVPYLEIVNGVLSARAAKTSGKSDVDALLAAAEHPFVLPFDRQHARLGELLKLLKTTPEQLHRLFTPTPDIDALARMRLGLSQAQAALLLRDNTQDLAALAQTYGLADAGQLASLADLEVFRVATQIDGPGIHELLYLRLSEQALNSQKQSEREAANLLFINAGAGMQGGYVRINSAQTHLEWSVDGKAPLPASWLDRAQRILRLSRWTGIALRDIDMVLRTLCGNTLNSLALRRLALVRELASQKGIEIEIVCSLLGELDSLGAAQQLSADGEATYGIEHADSLFDRVFNGEPAKLASAYFPSWYPYVPEPYQGFTAIHVVGDLMLDEHKTTRERIRRAVGLSTKELEEVVEKLRARAKLRGRDSVLSQTFGPQTLSLFHRIARLAEYLDIGPVELLQLLDVIEADPSLRGLGALGLVELQDAHVSDEDLYRVLESGTVDERSWMVRTIVAAMTWARAAGLGVIDLVEICLPPPVAEEITEELKADTLALAATQARLALCQGLVEAFAPTGLTAAALQSQEVKARAAWVAFTELHEGGHELLADIDTRLVEFENDAARTWAFASIAALDVIRIDELTTLGLGERHAELLHTSLMRSGVIDSEGDLVASSLEAETLAIEPALKHHAPTICTRIAALTAEARQKAGSDESIEVHLYLSDLLELGTTREEAAAILTNLYFRGVLDELGRVVKPDFFQGDHEGPCPKLESGLNEYESTIRAFFAKRSETFADEVLTIPVSTFESLALTSHEREGLVENLIFNEVLDDQRRVVDKQAILDLGPAELRLALPYHRHRRAVLSLLQTRIKEARAKLLRFSTAETLRPLADEIAARQLFTRMDLLTAVDEHGSPSAQLRARARTGEIPVFDPGDDFGEAQRVVLSNYLKRLVQERDLFVLTDKSAATIELDADGAEALRELLIDREDLLEDGGLNPERLDAFLDVNGAVSYDLEGSEDYAYDVFFLLHDLALRTRTRVDALVSALAHAADRQQDAVLTALAGGVELGIAETTLVVQHILRDDPQPIKTILSPLLAALEDGAISEIPEHQRLARLLDRVVQFAAYARKLNLGTREIELAFSEQGLTDKFTEALPLPPGVDSIDAMFEFDGELIVFRGGKLWTFVGDTLEPLEVAQPLSLLSPVFAQVGAIDAAYTDDDGVHWIYAAGKIWNYESESNRWTEVDRVLGKVESNFTAPESIDAALTDHEGVSYLFVDDQYLRSTDGIHVDQGYPRTTADHWPEELDTRVPKACNEGFDASFTDSDRQTWFFKEEHAYGSDDPEHAITIRERFGIVRNNFADMARVDGVAEVDGLLCIFADDQVIVHADSLEGPDARALSGYPTTIEAWMPKLPANFREQLDAGFTDWSGSLHLFHEERCVTRTMGEGGFSWSEGATRDRFGRVRNNLLETGSVDAAMMGLDGRLYLFSGPHYYRYSDLESGYADEGFPRTIAQDFGGIQKVDAAFVMDGRTYLFGSTQKDGAFYLRYSTRDYETPDEGYPKKTDDNWWNLPAKLVSAGFSTPDAVMNDGTDTVYLFSGDRYISFDHTHRLWTEPAPIRDRFDGLPFVAISAGMSDGDGHTWLFSNHVDEGLGDYLVVRYSDANFTHIDDRFPKPVRRDWGRIVNRLQEHGRVDAAMRVITPVIVEEPDEDELVSKLRQAAVEPPLVETVYIFSGDQFYRYTGKGNDLSWVDEGYPRSIDSALADEPRFAELDGEVIATIRGGIDGLWADNGSVFLFADDTIYVCSNQSDRTVPGVAGMRAAAVETGRLLIREGEAWRHLRMPESPASSRVPAHPAFLRGAPTEFRLPEAVLLGRDNNVYLFNNGRCWDRSLARDYPIADAWARAENAIVEDERVDAAVRDGLGRLYLFRGEQFLTYTPVGLEQGIHDGPLPPVADHAPAAIEERFGGLTNVHVAYRKGEQTWLFEAPDAEGTFRYQRYSGDELEEPDFDEPQTADISFWQLPDEYLEDGFDRIDAILVEDEDLFFIHGREFVHYEAATDTWTFPRDVELYWPGLPESHPSFEHIDAAFTDGPVTWFFSAGACYPYQRKQPGQLQDISDRWGKIDNRIRRLGRVDAVLSIGERTYLFAGDQYVRYSGDSYEYVDTGYPKRLAENLTEEPCFEHLPDELAHAFEALPEGSQGRVIDAAFASAGVVYLFTKYGDFACARDESLARTFDLRSLGQNRNTLQETGQVDASFVDHKGALWLLSGDQVYRYSERAFEELDDGFPRLLSEQFTESLVGTPIVLPEIFHTDVDAAMMRPDGGLVLLAEDEFVRLWPRDKNRPLERGKISALWQTPANPFVQVIDQPPPRIDAALLGPDGELLVFKGGHYIRYASPENEYVDEGYPRAIRDDWGALPAVFEAAIDGAFTFEGRYFFTRGSHYVRYSAKELSHAPGSYAPLPLGARSFTQRWRHANDYLLRDLHLIWRAVDFDRRRGVVEALGENGTFEGSFLDLLLENLPDIAEPYALLAALFECEADDLKWLTRRDSFLRRFDRNVAHEIEYDLELLLRAHDVMALCGRLGSYPREVYEQVWTRLYGSSKDPKAATDTLRRLLGTLYTGANWLTIERQLIDADHTARRDALVAWTVSQEPALAHPRDLYEEILIDVEVDPSIDTSRIKEAAAAIQLYFHRYLVNLEALAPKHDAAISPLTADREARATFKHQWTWLQNYRVWEANRKVFLHPENYIRPELRDTQTPVFQTLQDDLLQGEINDIRATEVFKKYLDEYTEVSRLAIAGGYIREGSAQASDRELILFGHTRTDPRRYYYRTATFIGGQTNAATWQAWQSLGLEIDADRVYPVDAFGRLFVFWASVEAESRDTSSTTVSRKTVNGNEQITGSTGTLRRLQVYFSYYDLNLRWVPAQKLNLSGLESRGIDGVQLVVERSGSLGAEQQENIIVGLSYSVGGQVRRLHASLTADLATHPATRPPADSAGIELFGSLFAPGERPQRIVRLNSSADSSEGPWYSFDLKGGSFLCKPEVGSLDPNLVTLRPLVGNPHNLPEWDGVDAGCTATDGNTYLFHNPGSRFATIDASGNTTTTPIQDRWGHIDNAILRSGEIDAAWWQGTKLFLSKAGAYLRYSNGTQYADRDGMLALSGNSDNLPEWSRIEGAFTDVTGRVWFFGNGNYTTSDDVKQSLPIRSRFGRVGNEFTTPTPNQEVVRAAFVDGQYTYLIGATTYLRYTGSNYSVCDAGYPKPQNLYELLAECGCTNNKSDYRDLKIVAVVQIKHHTMFLVEGGRTFALKKNDKVKELDEEGEHKFYKNGRTSARIGNRELVFGRGHPNYLHDGNHKISLPRAVTAAVFGLDGKLYLFAGDRFLALGGNPSVADIHNQMTAWDHNSKLVGSKWGSVETAIIRHNRVDAAVRIGNTTFLICDGEYVRYTGDAYQTCDMGYPKSLQGNPDGLPEWTTMSAAVESLGNQGQACFFRGTQHTFAGTLTSLTANAPRFGLIDNEMLSRGVDAAWVEGKQHLFIAGQQLIRYTADQNGQLGLYMDAGYPQQLALARFGQVRAAFVVGNDFYVVGEGVFVCCPVATPESIRPGYPKKGHLGALLHDVNMRHGTKKALASSGFEHLAIRGASVSGNRLSVDIDDGNNYYGATLRGHLDLNNGHFYVEWIHQPWNRIWGWGGFGGWGWAQEVVQAVEETTEVEVVVNNVRYRFRDSQFMRTAASVPVDPNVFTPDSRSVDQVWGAGAIDAALRLDGKVYLFLGDHYVRTPGQGQLGDLSLARAIDGAWGNLPASLREGVDAAMYSGGALTLFRGDQYVRFPQNSPEPYEISSVRYDIVRLTTATAATLNKRLFTGGLAGLLSLRTQEVDETPRFSATRFSTTTIQFNAARVGSYPIGSHLDFNSANGIYYWEIFFHAPFLIAQSLNVGQRFEEAREWYEYVFDPTEAPDLWKFLPFLAADVEQLAKRVADRLTRLKQGKVDISSVETELKAIVAALLPMDKAFQGERVLTKDELAKLQSYGDLSALRTKVDGLKTLDTESIHARTDLEESVGIIERLALTWAAMQSTSAQLRVFLDDPFDPHAIASLRRLAYRKALLMRYIDNLLDWGDMLFSQYTRESINEARMLYVLAWDLLGRRPTPLGRKVLPDARPFSKLRDASDRYDFLLYLESGLDPSALDLTFAAEAPQTMTWPSYFYLPENSELVAYWDRVEDRLYKIRHGLNLMGVKQPLPLFQPPLDPMAIVAALAGGSGLASAIAGAAQVSVPHYRFSFLLAKAQALVSKLDQFGGELLSTLEKRDAEQLSRLQGRQEGEILTMTIDVRKTQIEEALASERGLKQAHLGALERKKVYQQWIDQGFNGFEIAQLSLMSGSVVAHIVSTIARIVAAIGGAAPDVMVGPFSAGVQAGGDTANRSANSVAEIASGVAEGLSISGEILGIVGQHERMKQEWELQRDLATYDIGQLEQQIIGAQAQIAGARQELAIVERQISHSEAVADFYRSKFSNQELYQWMADRLSTLYFQTYQLALDYARAAEKAFQFEAGEPVQNVQFINGQYWDSQRKGLMAGSQLGHDLDRMEAAYIKTDDRRFEIETHISLLEHDPIALLKLQTDGRCEFEIGEAVFDYEFPGHYRRQIKTISLVIDAGEGVTIKAVLTQLTNRTVMHPDSKAVGFLLNAKGEAPVSLRSNWKPHQQVALSHFRGFARNDGMFELRFDSDRYLPFEGTGAVSRWRLELAGKPGSYDPQNIRDITVELSYTAIQGGEAFAAAVRGLLKPYDALRHFDLRSMFPEQWQAFLESSDDTLTLPLSQAMFPNIASSRIRSVLAHYVLNNSSQSAVSVSLDLGERVTLPEGRLIDTAGLRVGQNGSQLTLNVRGDKRRLDNLVLVMSYRAAVR